MMRWRHVGLIGLWGIVGAPGCAGTETLQSSQQEDRGLGIVQGTLGARQSWQSVPSLLEGTHAVAGQVLTLEGAAYVVEDGLGREYRIPHDENTRIDRPAHVGDRILVLLDGAGRAAQIWNIDHREDLP